MEYKAEKFKKLIRLYAVAEAESENGDKIKVRKLIGEKKYSEMMEDVNKEKEGIEKDIETANKRLEDIQKIITMIKEVHEAK